MHYDKSLVIFELIKRMEELEEAVFGANKTKKYEIAEDPEELGYYLREIIGDEPK